MNWMGKITLGVGVICLLGLGGNGWADDGEGVECRFPKDRIPIQGIEGLQARLEKECILNASRQKLKPEYVETAKFYVQLTKPDFAPNHYTVLGTLECVYVLGWKDKYSDNGVRGSMGKPTKAPDRKTEKIDFYSDGTLDATSCTATIKAKEFGPFKPIHTIKVTAEMIDERSILSSTDTYEIAETFLDKEDEELWSPDPFEQEVSEALIASSK